MTRRREFLASLGAFAAAAPRGRGWTPGLRPESASSLTPGSADREYWLNVLARLTEPVLTNLAEGRLRQRMPMEIAPAGGPDRRDYTHLEAVGRLLTGIAPWLELADDGSPEAGRRRRYAELARRGLHAATDAASPDFLNFARGRQPLVDAAFLAHAIVRAPGALWERLDAGTRRNVVAALKATRAIEPPLSNWLMFCAMIEAALSMMGEDWNRTRVDFALRQHELWYKGDGMYGDGPPFHWDYYNSFVIQPMLLDVMRLVGSTTPEWQAQRAPILARARRYAAIQERLISPEGTFPPIGRSLAYRFGAFQLLAQMALRHELPDGLSPAQVRSALTAVMRRMIEAPGTFDAGGWLTIGFCGHQPHIGEGYISTGSLYLCSAALLPLGLPPTDEFWAAPPADWTARKAWSGQDLPADHAI